jgi:hypothetical protein
MSRRSMTVRSVMRASAAATGPGPGGPGQCGAAIDPPAAGPPLAVTGTRRARYRDPSRCSTGRAQLAAGRGLNDSADSSSGCPQSRSPRSPSMIGEAPARAPACCRHCVLF